VVFLKTGSKAEGLKRAEARVKETEGAGHAPETPNGGPIRLANGLGTLVRFTFLKFLNILLAIAI